MAGGEAWLLGRGQRQEDGALAVLCGPGAEQGNPAFQGSGVSVIMWCRGLPVKSSERDRGCSSSRSSSRKVILGSTVRLQPGPMFEPGFRSAASAVTL